MHLMAIFPDRSTSWWLSCKP